VIASAGGRRSYETAFRSEARRAALEWKQTCGDLPDGARRPGAFGGRTAAYCLPSGFETLNLLPDARAIALERFRAAGIPWHLGCSGGPSGHLLSSQVQCANALAPFVADEPALRHILGRALPVAEVLPFGATDAASATLSPFDETDLVVFEWQGLRDHLNEWSGKRPARGSKATSADAAVRYRAHDGSIEVALIEWKYTEAYDGSPLSGAEDAMRTRVARYARLFEHGPVDEAHITLLDLFIEPMYQLLRLALLAKAIEATHECGVECARVLYIAPRANDALWTSPGADRFAELAAAFDGKFDRTWQSLLRDPDSFAVLDSAWLVSPDVPTSAAFKSRYRHLATASADRCDTPVA
jgi:hypothetical protein